MYNGTMKKRGWITLLILVILWIISAYVVDNSIKLPSFFDVLYKMIVLAQSPIFYQSFGITLLRSVVGLILALFVALVLGISCGLNSKIEEYFEPIYIILKSIPNISYILIALIWSNSTITMYTISFMVMFPVAYSNVLKGMKSIDTSYLDVMKIYSDKISYNIIHVYLPLISNYIMASISVGIGLTFKVGIMAEILGSLSSGVGRQFQLCRINVDMVGTFAWTIWLILLLIVLESFARIIMNKMNKTN